MQGVQTVLVMPSDTLDRIESRERHSHRAGTGPPGQGEARGICGLARKPTAGEGPLPCPAILSQAHGTGWYGGS